MKRHNKPRFRFWGTGRRRCVWYESDCSECDWCHRKYKWPCRPCLTRGWRCRGNSTMRTAYERARMENEALRRSKTMPRALRRAAKIAAAESSNNVDHGRDHHDEDDSEAPRNDRETPAEEEINSDTPITQPNSTPTPSKQDNKTFQVTKIQQQRQSKACTGHKDAIYEGVSLALDEDEDVARILAANRKAWPRGQAPIAVNATPEDKEIAELIRTGLLAREELAVNHWDDDTASEDFCPYTVRIVEAGRKSGRKRNSRSREGPGHAVEQAPLEEADSDWWHLDEEVLAQLLSDGAFDLKDGSEFSFVYVD
ncbi:hypothetical protein QBC37DRAFT_70864 [Rhypophila decipiens]|uniref:Uncharacterized protein n=1 Tax=Rhypophila decipiens TaxID=261697 RepID=A0AAN6Y1M0_9PEZI|nr:hypothetical protein QBC37DRAFT_70864 [Rhypophila decipiens]